MVKRRQLLAITYAIVILLVIALIVIILIKPNQTTKKTTLSTEQHTTSTHRPSEPTVVNKQSKTASNQQTSLSNTGPGDIVLVFLASSLIATLVYRVTLVKRINN